MTEQRRLAAIVAADVVGYSALVGKDESGTLARLQALPSVSSAGAISWLPLTFDGGSNALFVEGRPLPSPGEQEYVVYRLVTPGYFRTLSIPLIAGWLKPRSAAAAPQSEQSGDLGAAPAPANAGDPAQAPPAEVRAHCPRTRSGM